MPAAKFAESEFVTLRTPLSLCRARESRTERTASRYAIALAAVLLHLASVLPPPLRAQDDRPGATSAQEEGAPSPGTQPPGQQPSEAAIEEAMRETKAKSLGGEEGPEPAPGAEPAAPAERVPAVTEAPAPVAEAEAGMPVQAEGFDLGLGLALVNLPQESDFEGEVPAFDLFTTYRAGPWWNWRAGYNRYQSALKGTDLTTNALYAAWMARAQWLERLETSVALGAALASSSFDRGGGSNSTDSGLALLTGFGFTHLGERLRLGAQLLVLTRRADFDGVTLAAGSNQLQITIAFPLN
jgi:hypothetical protein